MATVGHPLDLWSMKKCVLLLSGGLDSATTLAIAKSQGYFVSALSFDYGQRHSVELDSAKKVAAAMGVTDHRVAKIDLRIFGGSALTSDLEVPHGDDPMSRSEIPITYVPARNTVFLSFALAMAETIGAFDIFIGANQVDYSGYPDCRGEYLDAFAAMANLATAASVEGRGTFSIQAPLLDLTKDQIIQRGLQLGVPYELTISCYDPIDGKACTTCDSCQIRRSAFAKLNLSDPAPSIRGYDG